jgi:hypothetical protein
MLKICPNDYLPPYECLHFVRDEYLELPLVRQIKRNKWEAIWERKKGKGPKNHRDFEIN